MLYTLEYITMLPEPSATCERVARKLAEGDELFSSKFVDVSEDFCTVGTPEYPRFMNITTFGDPAKPGMFCITAKLDDPAKLEFQRYVIGHTLREALSANHVYLVHDDVSRHIAGELHPKLSHIERQLRTFLNRFFLNVVGPDWLIITASPEVYRKMTMRRDRDPENWKALFDNELAFMDFSEIGALITKQSTGLSNPDDLPLRIQRVHTLEDLQALKHDLESNYSKYFRETFQERKFHKLWSRLNIIRNKVAHNGPLTSEDKRKVDEAIPKLERLLRDAELRIRSVQLSEKELETVKLQKESLAEAEPSDYHDLKPSIKVLGRIDLSKVHGHGDGHSAKRRTTADAESDTAESDDEYD